MSVTAFPLERRIDGVEAGFRQAARERRIRLYHPPNGRASSELEVLSAPALRNVDVVRVMHSYPQVEFYAEIPYAPSAFAGIVREDEIVSDEPPLIDSTITFPLSIRDIARAACRHFNVNMLDLVSARRTANLVRPRQITMYLARLMTKRSLPEIGRMLNRDHTTVLFTCRKVSKWIMTDEELAADVQAVRDGALAGRVPAEQPVTG